MTPTRPCKIWDMVRWNISGAELIPNGRRLKQYRPNGVTNVVRCCDSTSRGICQNPLLASSLENILLLPNCARLSSTVGIGWTSLWTALLGWVRSTQMRRSPLGLGTGTTPAHQVVGEVTEEITPCWSIVCIWLLTFGSNGKGTFRGLYIEAMAFGIWTNSDVTLSTDFTQPRE